MALSFEEFERLAKVWNNGQQIKQHEIEKQNMPAPKYRTVPTLESKRAEKANEADMKSLAQANDLMASQKSKRNTNNTLKQTNPLNKVASNGEKPKSVSKYVNNDTKNTLDMSKAPASNSLKEPKLKTEKKSYTNSSDVDKYIDPSYKMSKNETQRAKQIVSDYFDKNEKARKALQLSSSNPYQASKVRAQMTDKERKEYDKMTSLMNKSSDLSAYTYGLLNIVPFGNTAMNKLGEIAGGDSEYNYTAQKKNVKEQSPLAYMGGDATSKLAAYMVLGKALGNIPVLNQATNEIGEAMSFGREALGKGIGNVLRGNIADIILDTIPTEIENYQNGMRGMDLVKDTLANEAINTVFNAGGEVLPQLFKAIKGGKNIDNVAEAAEDAVRSVDNTPRISNIDAERMAEASRQSDLDALREGNARRLEAERELAYQNRPRQNLINEQASNVDEMENLRRALAEQNAPQTPEIPRVGEEPSLIAKTENPVEEVAKATNPDPKHWSNWKVGDEVDIVVNDEPGIAPRRERGIVSKVEGDHAIVDIGGDEHHWVDDSTADLFEPVTKDLQTAKADDKTNYWQKILNDKKFLNQEIKKAEAMYKSNGMEMDRETIKMELQDVARRNLKNASVTPSASNVESIAKSAPKISNKIDNKGISKIQFNDANNKAAFDSALDEFRVANENFDNILKNAESEEEINDAIDGLIAAYDKVKETASNGHVMDKSGQSTLRDLKKDFKNLTKGMVINLPADLRNEMGFADKTMRQINSTMSSLGGNDYIKFSAKGGTPIDEVWDELVKASGGELDPNAINNADMANKLLEYVEGLKVADRGIEQFSADISHYIPDEYWDDLYRRAYEAEQKLIDEGKVVAEDVGLNPNTVTDDIPSGRETDYGSIKYEEEVPQGAGTVSERPEFDNPNPQFGTSDFYNNTLRNIVDEDEFAKYYDSADYLYEKGNHNQMLDNSYSILKRDFAGEYNRLLNLEKFEAQDVATASMIRDFLAKSGHAKEASEFANRIRPMMSTSTAQALEAHKLFARSTPEGAVDELIIQINKAIDKAKGEGYSATIQRLGDKVSDAIKNEDDDLLVKLLDDDLGSHAIDKKGKVRYKNKKVVGKQEVLDFVKEQKAQKKSAAEIAEEAKKMLVKANGGADVSYEAENTLLDFANKMEELDPKSREYKELEAQMGRYAQNFMPASLGNKVKSILYTNMLGNLKTALSRNFVGNVVANTIEKTQKPLRVGLDRLLSKKTGVRNYTLGNWGEQIKSYGRGFKYGGANQLKDIKTGLNTTRSGEEGLLNALDNNTKAWKYNTPMVDAKTWKSDASLTDKGRYALNKVNDLVMGVMGLGDNPIYEATYAATKTELNYILEKFGEDAIQTVGTTGKEASVGDLINFWAHQRALESVFQQGSLTADGLSKIKQAVGEISKDNFGFDVLSMPVSAFTQVPGNIISVGMDYSPAGIIKNAANTIAELKGGNFNQKRFVDQTTRNLTGGLMLGGGVAAYNKGRITGPKSDDTDKNKAETSANELEYALNLPGNTQMDISDIPYLGGTLQGAAAFADALGEAKKGIISYPEAYSRGIGAATEAMFGTSATQGLNRLLGAGNTYNTSNKMSDNLKNTLGSSLAMFVPSLLRQTAAATDEYKRDLGKYGSFDYYLNNVKNSVPLLRQTLPIKTNNQGVPYLQNQGRNLGMKLAENYVLPYTISQPDRVYSDMDKVANSLYDVLGTDANAAYTPGISRKTATEWLGDNFSEDNYYLLKQQYGNYDSELGNAVIGSDIFGQLSPAAQVSALDAVHKAAKELTNRNYGGSNSNKVADLYQGDDKEGAINSILYGSLFSEYGNSSVKPKYSEYSKDYYDTYGQQGLEALKKVIGSSTKQEQWLANLRDHSKELNLSSDQVESMIKAIKGDDLANDVLDGKKTATEYYLGKAADSSTTYNKEVTKETTTRTGLNSDIPQTVGEMMRLADTSNRDGYPNAKEAQIYLDSLDLTREEKAEIYPQMFRKTPKSNPYK